MLSSNVAPMGRYNPSEQQVEAAARAWLGWQFPGRTWETALDGMKEKMREGARVVLRAAHNASDCN